MSSTNTPPSASHDRSDEETIAFSQRRGSLQAPMVVNEIADGCLYSGLFGRLDSSRVKSVTDRILESVEQTDCELIILDMANIDMIDSIVANHILRIHETLRLVGVETILCGISPIVAQTMVATGISTGSLRVARNLKRALQQVANLRANG